MLAVKEWRSVWQMDMFNTAATPDDLLHDMAAVHVDVQLQAIFTCARVAEFAAQTPGKPKTLYIDLTFLQGSCTSLEFKASLEKSLNFRKLKKALNCFGKRVEGLEKFGICLL